jgi:hypothetical protein
METERELLNSILLETLIPEDGSTHLPELLEDISSLDARPGEAIFDIKRRDLLFIGKISYF